MVESPSPNTKSTSQVELHHAASWIEKGVSKTLQSKSLWKEASQYSFTKEYPDLIMKKITPLPPALVEQYSYVESKCFMGIFPEIERAWFTVDNKLFLWNYNQDSDFIAYDVSDQVIISVCLANPRHGVFTERFRYVLIVANTVEILLFGVNVSTLATSSYNILLVPTKFRVSTDYVTMLRICSTPEGRVFLSGSDGCLYEFVYGTSSDSSLSWIRSWKSNYCQKVNHSFSLAQHLLPDIFRRFIDEDPLIDICFDGLHSYLFTLSEKGWLTLYHVSTGSRLSRSSYVYVLDDIGQLGGMEAKSRPRSFLNIYSSCERESSFSSNASTSTIEVVVFTSLGERIYYSVILSVLGSYVLKAQKYRHFPALDTSLPLIHVTLWSKGFVLMADARDVMHDSIIAIQPSIGKLSLFSESDIEMTHTESITQISLHELVSGVDPSLREQASLSQVKAWDFAEKTSYLSPGYSITLAWEEERSIFLCLTNTALVEVERQQPIDHLCRILENEPNNLNSFINRYGLDELCALCVSIASATLQEDNQLFPKISPKVAEEAVRVYFAFGGAPQWIEQSSSRSVQNGAMRKFDIGRPAKSVSSAFKFSSAHNGIVTKLSRDVCRIWNCHYVKKESEAYMTICWTPHEMKAVRIRVQATARFIQKYIVPGIDSSFSWLSFGERETNENRSIQDRLYRDLFQRKKMEEAKKAEYRSLLSLYHLACRISEALSLLTILYDNQFHRLVSSLTESYQASLQRITFGDFCVSEAGRRLASSLITTLFQYYGQEEEEGLVESLTELLSSQCPSFFGKEERCLQSGKDLLSRARSLLQVSEDRNQVYLLVERAIEEFRKVIPVIEDWKEICAKVESVGAISLLFGFLLESIAIIRFQQQNEKLEECYEILLSLTQRYLLSDASFYYSEGEEGHEEPWKDSIIERMRQLKDKVFHKRLCSYLLTMGERGTSLLIRLASPVVESYLLEQQRYDVLWKYYGHEGRYKEAAAVLVKLSKESPSFSLDERISWLGQALQLANLQLAKSGGASADERILVKEIQDCLDIAKIQVRCKEELARRHPSYSDIEEPTLSYIQSIDKNLMDLSTIYNHIARPMELWETELDILRCAEYEDIGLVQHLWLCLIDDCLFPQSSTDMRVYSTNGENWKLLEGLFVRLGKDFSSSMNVFPLNFLVQFLEQRHFEWLQLRTVENGHSYFDIQIYRWFVSIGHSRDMILSSYCKCLEEGLSFVAPLRLKGSLSEITSWSDDRAQYHLIQVIKSIIEDSISTDLRTTSSLLSSQSGLREESLQRAVSLCCNRLRMIHLEGREALLNVFSSLKRL
ncbi:hypothetical protein GpartN1_g5904.t1 [Galdieria partita]|uniref:Nuclear pore complex protein Nup155 n=1 Tax=Galdieria partita TaxID=83374 RepID=A0A9C7Q067_9RHOD|nr:hypothetical protein GpartN1_g5904.t1 [Galdieria partita]